jgi:hypothetical protein
MNNTPTTYAPETLFWIIKAISKLQEVYNEQCKLLWINNSMTYNNVAEAQYAVDQFIRWTPVVETSEVA